MLPPASKENKEIVLNILRYYENLEKQQLDKPLRCYFHNEPDSSQSPFESMSNGRAICLKSHLSGKDIVIVDKMFHAIWDRNFWIVNGPEEFFCNEDEEFSEKEIKDMEKINSENIDLWINFAERVIDGKEYKHPRYNDYMIDNCLIIRKSVDETRVRAFTIKDLIELLLKEF